MLISELEFETKLEGFSNSIYTAQTELGTITVMDRLTGWGNGNIRDTETGFHDKNGSFWLTSGMFDIRDYPDATIEDAVKKIKAGANISFGK